MLNNPAMAPPKDRNTSTNNPFMRLPTRLTLLSMTTRVEIKAPDSVAHLDVDHHRNIPMVMANKEELMEVIGVDGKARGVRNIQTEGSMEGGVRKAVECPQDQFHSEAREEQTGTRTVIPAVEDRHSQGQDLHREVKISSKMLAVRQADIVNHKLTSSNMHRSRTCIVAYQCTLMMATSTRIHLTGLRMIGIRTRDMDNRRIEPMAIRIHNTALIIFHRNTMMATTQEPLLVVMRMPNLLQSPNMTMPLRLDQPRASRKAVLQDPKAPRVQNRRKLSKRVSPLNHLLGTTHSRHFQ